MTCMNAQLFFVFDVESVGLHGEGYYVGHVVVNRSGACLDFASYGCLSDHAKGDDDGRAWMAKNVPPLPAAPLSNPKAVRDMFWRFWMHWRDKGAVMVADCCWPVEARFLAACVDDDPVNRQWIGPCPLHDVASVLLAAGEDPLKKRARIVGELPEHDPLCDARQSARILTTVLGDVRDWMNCAARHEP